ncbi:MAG: helix-turn-helix domain-containing protein [Opitutales bacterium]
MRCEPGWHLGPGWSQALHDFDLWFVWDGRGRMLLDQGEVVLHPGVCVWMRPGHRYEAEQDADRRLGVNFIHFSLKQPGVDLPLSAFRPRFEVLHSRQVEFVDVMMRRIIELRAEPGAATASAATLMGGLLLELEREQAAAVPQRTSATDQRHRDVMLRLAARIRESPAHTAAVADLARAAGYSVDHFSRLFLKVIGSRPQDYIIQAKIERARQLLAESDLTVGLIAEALGFQDIFYFSRQFRQRTGQAPTEFRQGRRGA